MYDMAGVLLIVKKKVFIIYLILLLCHYIKHYNGYLVLLVYDVYDSPSDPDELMSSAKK